MKFVINNKMYDTDKMVSLGNVKKWFESTDWMTVYFVGKGKGRVYDCEIFKSNKGNHLLVRKINDQHCAEVIEEIEVKELLMKYNYDRYAELYGEIEEA